MANLSQSYGTSPAITGSHSVTATWHKWTASTPARQAGIYTRFTYHGNM